MGFHPSPPFQYASPKFAPVGFVAEVSLPLVLKSRFARNS